MGHSLGLGGFRFLAIATSLEERTIRDYSLMPPPGTSVAPGVEADGLFGLVRRFGQPGVFLDTKESGPQAFLDFVNQRLAKRQRELDEAVKFSSHYAQVESIILELKTVRSKFVTFMRREGLL